MELYEKYFIIKEILTPVCHASTIYKKKNGEILTAWFGGSREGADDVGIFLSRKSEGADFQIAEKMAGGQEPHWNPVLFSTNDQKVFLFYKKGRKIVHWRTYIRISQDGGRTFGKEQELVTGDIGGRGPVRNKPIQLQNGRILCPGSVEGKEWKAFVDISENNGESFVRSNWIEIAGMRNLLSQTKNMESGKNKNSDIPVSDQSFYGRGVIQPTLWADDNSEIHMLLRSTEGRIYRSDSKDGGYNWSEAVPTEIPNNNSGIDMTKLADGRLVLVHNPVGENWGMRSPLSLSVSEDNGKTFSRLYDLESGPGEYSYPAIVSEKDEVYITYTYNRKNIVFCHMKI